MSELTTIRRLLAGIFVCGSLGTAAELLLLEHTEDVWQNVPIGLLVIGCATVALLIWRPTLTTHRIFQVLMWLFIVSGLIGVGLHYTGNHEFAREVDPEAKGAALIWEGLSGGIPALAPGTMILLGAVGLVFARAHSLLAREDGASFEKKMPVAPGRHQNGVGH